jgi:hypothetical protein
MKPCRSSRLWNRCLLVALVLLVVGSALCTVAGSAAAQERGLIAAAAAP